MTHHDDLAERVTRFSRTPSCGSVSLSPDGTTIALTSSLSGSPQAWTVPAAGGWPAALTSLDDQVTSVRWSPDGAWLALQVAPGGGLHTQAYVVRPDGSGLRRLTAGGDETNVVSWWAPGGRLLVATNERRRSAMDVLAFDVETGEQRLVAELAGTGGVSDVSPDGRTVLVQQVPRRGDVDLLAFDLEGAGPGTDLWPHDAPARLHGAAFTPDGRWALVASDVGRDRLALARVPFGHDGGPEVLVGRDDADLQQLAMSADRRVAFLVWNVGGRFEVERMDVETGERSPGPAPAAEVVAAVSPSRDGSAAAVLATGSQAPENVWAWSGGATVPVTRLAPAGVDLATLVRPEAVHFAAHDGLPLTGWLYRAARTPGPVVLSFHGGPEAQELPRFAAPYQLLVEAGISVFAPNVRGSSGFGKLFMQLDDRELRFDAVRDIRSCAEWLLAAGVGRAGALGIMGGSYGGFMTMSGVTEHPDLFAAACTIAGLVNFETFFAHTEPWMAAVSGSEYGDPETQRDLLRRLSPIHRLDRVVAPTLVIHGANDTNVPVVEADQVVHGLRERGVPVEYLLFPDEGHGITRISNVVTATAAIVRWFTRHLDG